MSCSVVGAVALTAMLPGAAAVADVGRPLAANPCAPKSTNPCAAKNPCAPKNPCARKNPCATKPPAVKDPVSETASKQYGEWKKVNMSPVLSATHATATAMGAPSGNPCAGKNPRSPKK